MDKKENIYKFCRGQKNIGTTIIDGINKLFGRTKEKPSKENGQGKE